MAKKRQRRSKKKASIEKEKGSSLPAILQRLRHSDAPIRQAALVGLLHSRFSLPDTTAIPSDLLQTVRDQVACSIDIPCSSLAASCLGNYLGFQQDNDESQYNPEFTAGWFMIFVRRLQEATTVASSSMDAQRIELAEKCAFCMVQLLENNPVVIERLDCTTLVPLFVSILQPPQPAEAEGKPTTTTGVERLQALIARCIHTLWDENPSAVRSCAALLPHLVALLQQNDNNPMATLHAAGACLAAWKCVPDPQTQNLFTPHIPTCLGLLQTTFPLWTSSAGTREVLQTLETAYMLFVQQQDDATLEHAILTAQTTKKEPARAIARRLKGHDTIMGTSKLLEDRSDKETAWQETLEQWQDQIEPLQLALEIMANVTAATGHGMHKAAPYVVAAVSQTQLADQVLQLFNDLSLSAWYTHNKKTDEETKGDNGFLTALAETTSALQSKAAICVGHCVSNVPDWNPPLLWQQLRHVQYHPGAAMEQVICTLAVAVQSRPRLRQQVDAQDITFLLDVLTQSATGRSTQELVGLLGLLCSSEPHPAPVNKTIVQAFMTVASREDAPAFVLAEVLNNLMDLYGPDDCHPQVFAALNVLAFFQTTVPKLKSRMNVEQHTGSSSLFDPDEMELWQETIENAARFIEYKNNSTGGMQS